MAKVKIQGHASGTGILTVTAPNTSTDRTITLPDTTGTLLDENSSVPAANLTGTVADARISALTASKLTGALPAISGAALTGISGGKVLQVVYEGGSTGINFTDSSTNLELESATITPAATSSKILCIANYSVYMNGTSSFNGAVAIRQGSTTIGEHHDHRSGGTYKHAATSIVVLHSPNTTSATEYKLTYTGSQGSGEVNTEDDTNGISLTLIEIGA